MTMAVDAVALAEELGLRDRHVFFNADWVPYRERGRYLLDADLAVSAHFDDVETRFAFRTRLLDCLWAGLPVVTTRGDTLGDVIVDAGAGRAVEFGDVAGWVEAVESLLEGEARERASAASAALRPPFEWPAALAPLLRLADAATPIPRRAGRIAALEYLALRLEVGYRRHGLRGAAERVSARAATARRRR